MLVIFSRVWVCTVLYHKSRSLNWLFLGSGCLRHFPYPALLFILMRGGVLPVQVTFVDELAAFCLPGQEVTRCYNDGMHEPTMWIISIILKSQKPHSSLSVKQANKPMIIEGTKEQWKSDVVLLAVCIIFDSDMLEWSFTFLFSSYNSLIFIILAPVLLSSSQYCDFS